jgi:hypothetical protein
LRSSNDAEAGALRRTTFAIQFQHIQPMMLKPSTIRGFLALTAICVSQLAQKSAIQGKIGKALTQYLTQGIKYANKIYYYQYVKYTSFRLIT